MSKSNSNHNNTSARHSVKSGHHIQSSASELMMKHARKEQMLIAEVVSKVCKHVKLIEREHGEQEEDVGATDDSKSPDCAGSGVVPESLLKTLEATGGESPREGEREP